MRWQDVNRDGRRDLVVEFRQSKLEFSESDIVADVEFGEPADVIATRAKEWAADLIVMGAHGRGTLGTLVLGSVAQKVLRQADVPVMLVK